MADSKNGSDGNDASNADAASKDNADKVQAAKSAPTPTAATPIGTKAADTSGVNPQTVKSTNPPTTAAAPAPQRVNPQDNTSPAPQGARPVPFTPASRPTPAAPRSTNPSAPAGATAQDSSRPAVDTPFRTAEGAATDRPPANDEDVVVAATGGSAPPIGDEVTQGGSGGPPGQVITTLESASADSAAAQAGVVRKFDAHTYTHSAQIITPEKLATMSKPEIRAVAADRGYDDLGMGGKPSLIRRFLDAQQKHIDDAPDDLHEAGSLTHEDAAQEQADVDNAKLAGGPSEYAEGQNAKRLADRRAELITNADARRADANLAPQASQSSPPTRDIQ